MSESRKEYQKKYHKQWVKNNRERMRELDTKHRNSPKGLATRKKWDEANREKRREYQREWRKKNPEKVKVYEAKRGRNHTNVQEKLKKLQEEYKQLYGNKN